MQQKNVKQICCLLGAVATVALVGAGKQDDFATFARNQNRPNNVSYTPLAWQRGNGAILIATKSFTQSETDELALKATTPSEYGAPGCSCIGMTPGVESSAIIMPDTLGVVQTLQIERVKVPANGLLIIPNSGSEVRRHFIEWANKHDVSWQNVGEGLEVVSKG